MDLAIVAALALPAAASPTSAGAPLSTDLSYAMPIAGDWNYVLDSGGSQATFSTGSGQPQLTIRCTRSTRRIAIIKQAAAPSPSVWIWTSSQTQSLPATYDASAARVSAELSANDPLLDAIASSRGRVGIGAGGTAPLIVPPWAEIARVIEDCRS